MDTRRSAAVQFFMEADSESADYKSVVQCLNDAALASDAVKLDLLRKVKEIILHKDSSLLDNFLDEMLAFQNDRSAEVRKYIVGFIEEALKRDPEVLPRVASNLALLAQDNSIQVQKRIVQAASNIYRNTLAWLAKVRTVTEDMENAWLLIGKIKEQIIIMLDSENDGLRTQSVKFLETVVLLQTYPEADSQGRGDDFSLEDVPLTLKIARRRKLEEEANRVFELLLKFLNSPHISSINLMTSVASLLLIAKKRPLFMSQVISAIEKLRNNLPPTLSQSQIVSATKHIKTQLLIMLKHPSSVEFHGAITTLLTEMGATNHEITKAFPQLDELRRRQKRMAESAAQMVQAKKPRIEVIVQESEDSDDDSEVDYTPLAENQLEVAVSVTEAFIVERLTAELAIQLVMQAMLQLPDTMPPHFSSTYTPIAAAGTTKQIKTVGRLLATQMTASGVGPGMKEARKVAPLEPVPVPKPAPVIDIDEGSKSPAPAMMAKVKEEPKDKGLRAAVLTKPSKIRTKTLKLSEITKPLGKDVASRMLASALTRILRSERVATMAGAGLARSKIITTLASTFSPNVREVVLSFILEDIRRHIDLCLGWLYEEYSFLQGFNRFPAKLKKDQAPDFNYNQLLCRVTRTLINMPDHKDRDGLLIRLYLESPMITEEATDMLRAMCGDETRASIGLPLLQELVTKRPPKQLTFLNALLVHTAHENIQVRGKAIDCVVSLYDRGDLRSIIEEYSILYLSFLRLPQPPDVLFGTERGRPNKEDSWSEELVKACLYLYLTLVPINQTLIHELARVYAQTVALVKRIVLRCVEHPISGMGMESPQLLKLVEECPKGAETLVTRVIHILTDKVPPSAELVARVRDLYHTRVSDVRFLIPVLTGLSKKEVISALPKLIKLNPVVVKEVFNRLLGTHADMAHSAQITPAELLIALHNIDPSKAELKFVIKATSMCFAEQQAYTQEVLAVVMQNLMELNPLPTLLMRTVIQSMSLYPRLIGFVMNILQRLILKQVWKQRKVWEGFIKCCQRTQPQSYQVLLQLPPLQLADVFASSPDIQPALLAHVAAFTDHQRAHVSQAIMDVLTGKVTTAVTDFDESSDPNSHLPISGSAADGSRMEPLPPGMD